MIPGISNFGRHFEATGEDALRCSMPSLVPLYDLLYQNCILSDPPPPPAQISPLVNSLVKTDGSPATSQRQRLSWIRLSRLHPFLHAASDNKAGCNDGFSYFALSVDHGFALVFIRGRACLNKFQFSIFIFFLRVVS
jgi:hypothetical protein